MQYEINIIKTIKTSMLLIVIVQNILMKKKNDDDYNDEYYNIYLNCTDKIVEFHHCLMNYN